MVDRKILRVSATLLFAGVVLSLAAGLFHTDRANPNDHLAAFADYAVSGIWTAAHLGQFTGMLVLLAGLLALFPALNVNAGLPSWLP